MGLSQVSVGLLTLTHFDRHFMGFPIFDVYGN